VLGALFAALVVAGPASAESLPAPPGFHLRASNGYSLTVLAGGNPENARGSVLVLVQKRNSAVLYTTHAVVTETSIKADLGSVGRINVNFVPSGQRKTERPDCGGKPFTFDSGRYEGVIDFEGEHGYSRAHAASARGEAKLALSLVCAGPATREGSGGNSPGARLTARRKGRAGLEFVAMKNSPSRPARFTATVQEKRGELEILRSVGVTARPRAFNFDVPSGVATVEPPAPFSGRGEFRRRRGGGSTWRGDLTVDFPGRPNVRLTNGSTHASLERAVLNPGHPF
jgi:hypothetical protein